MKYKIKIFNVIVVISALLLLLNVFIPLMIGGSTKHSIYEFIKQLFVEENEYFVNPTITNLRVPYGILSFTFVALPILLVIYGIKSYKKCGVVSCVYAISLVVFFASYSAFSFQVPMLGLFFGVIISSLLAIVSLLAIKKPGLRAFLDKTLTGSEDISRSYEEPTPEPRKTSRLKELENTTRVCPFCETIIEDGESFCGGCGQAVGSTEISHVVNKKIDITPLSSAESREVPKEKEDSSKEIPAGKKTCSACGNVLNEYEIFCGVCGLSTKSTTTASKSSTVVVKEEKITTTPSSIATVSTSGLKSTMRTPKEKSDAERINKEIGNSFFNKADDL